MERKSTNWKRGDVIWAVGQITDKLIRDLREQMRREKILSAGQSAEDQFTAHQGEGAAPGKENGEAEYGGVPPHTTANKLTGGGFK